MSAVEQRKYIGAPVLRKEDAKFLTGQGSYVENLSAAGMLHVALARSPFAHAELKGVDVSAALAAPGVVAAFAAADLAEDWGGPLPCAWPVTEDIKIPEHFPLASDRVRYVVTPSPWSLPRAARPQRTRCRSSTFSTSRCRQ